MWNPPTQKQLENIPKLYQTEGIPCKEKVIVMHFFFGGCDWYVVEYSPEEKIFFGYAILNNDYACAEWGYFSLEELESINVKGMQVDKDLHWKSTEARNVPNIAKGYNTKLGI